MSKDRPSGSAWPPALRRKLGIPAVARASSVSDANNRDADSDSDLDVPRASALRARASAEEATFTSHELRTYIRSGYAALTSIQRQLYRGEEMYYEDTYARGNLMTGFDNIWIENPNSSSGGASSGAGGDTSLEGSTSGADGAVGGGNKPPKSVPARKMPGELRWFSNSCGAVPVSGETIRALERPSLVARPPTPPTPEPDAKGELAKERKEAAEALQIVGRGIGNKESAAGSGASPDGTPPAPDNVAEKMSGDTEMAKESVEQEGVVSNDVSEPKSTTTKDEGSSEKEADAQPTDAQASKSGLKAMDTDDDQNANDIGAAAKEESVDEKEKEEAKEEQSADSGTQKDSAEQLPPPYSSLPAAKRARLDKEVTLAVDASGTTDETATDGGETQAKPSQEADSLETKAPPKRDAKATAKPAAAEKAEKAEKKAGSTEKGGSTAEAAPARGGRRTSTRRKRKAAS